MTIGGIMEMMFSNFWSAEKIVYPHFTSQQTAFLASIVIVIIIIIVKIVIFIIIVFIMMMMIQVAAPTKLNPVPAAAEAGVIWSQSRPQLFRNYHHHRYPPRGHFIVRKRLVYFLFLVWCQKGCFDLHQISQIRKRPKPLTTGFGKQLQPS